MTKIGRRLPVVYIAAPFRATSDYGRKLNRDAAEAVAFKVWEAGAVALCPHLNTANFDGALPDHVWLAGDLELLRRCDAILMSKTWNGYTGARAEHDFAVRHGLQSFYEESITLGWEGFKEWARLWEPL